MFTTIEPQNLNKRCHSCLIVLTLACFFYGTPYSPRKLERRIKLVCCSAVSLSFVDSVEEFEYCKYLIKKLWLCLGDPRWESVDEGRLWAEGDFGLNVCVLSVLN